jgi:uncharacterized pyridoxamine 5'-phosphate oxidase family protein
MTAEFLYNIIRNYKYAVMATISASGVPESACVGFVVTPDLHLIFDTISDSRKYVNLQVNPNIAFVIGCHEEQTIQYEGIAKVSDIAELDKLLPLYFAAFPDGIERKEQLGNIVYFCVEPRWIRHSDFKTTTAQIEEIKF